MGVAGFIIGTVAGQFSGAWAYWRIRNRAGSADPEFDAAWVAGLVTTVIASARAFRTLPCVTLVLQRAGYRARRALPAAEGYSEYRDADHRGADEGPLATPGHERARDDTDPLEEEERPREQNEDGDDAHHGADHSAAITSARGRIFR